MKITLCILLSALVGMGLYALSLARNAALPMSKRSAFAVDSVLCFAVAVFTIVPLVAS